MDWAKTKKNKLQLTIKASDFLSAVALINQIAEKAEELNHHPDLFLKNYNELTIEIYTHDAGLISEKDWELAKDIEKLLKENK